MPVATVNDTNLSFVERGTGEPVVFAHGGLADQRVWHRQIEVFAEQYRAVAVSCRGYWPNEKLRDDEAITVDTYVDDLVEFIRALGSGPVHLIGHSSPGGFASLKLARQRPELLRSLVLVEPPAFPLLGLSIPPRPGQLLKLLLRDRRTAIDFIKFGARTMSPAVKAFDGGNDEQAVRIFLAGNGSDARSIPTLPQDRFERFLENAGPLKAQLRAGFPDFTPDDARGIQVPTMLVAGSETPGHLSKVTDELERLVPHVERVDIQHAGHMMFETQPEAFNRAVLEFIGRHTGR